VTLAKRSKTAPNHTPAVSASQSGQSDSAAREGGSRVFREFRAAASRFGDIGSGKRDTSGEILFSALTRGHRRHPRGRPLFPLIAGDGPLVRAVRIHHEKLRIGLRAPVIERSFIAKAQARAAEDDVLAVGRPRTVSIVSRGVRQLLEVGAIRPDAEDVVRVCATCFTGEGDAVTLRRPGGEVVVSRGQLGALAVVQVQDLQAAFFLRPHAIHDALPIRRPAGKAAIEGAAGEWPLFGTVRANHDQLRGLAFAGVENGPVSENNPLPVRRPRGRESSSPVLLEELLAVRAIQIADVNCNLIEGDDSERADVPEGAERQFTGARNGREFARESEVEGLILGEERLVLLRIVGELLVELGPEPGPKLGREPAPQHDALRS
jgi:hypothetical protein